MDLQVNVHPDEHVLLWINGRLAAEIVGGSVELRDDLFARVRRAHCLVSLERQVEALPALIEEPEKLICHVNTTAKVATEAFWRGFQNGILERTKAHPTQATLPEIPPEQSLAHDRSYRAARALMEALRQGARGPGETPGALAQAEEVKSWA